mmetsp:Transcript_102195/g.284635  ORF Transcript_102195/g.284635 Transcript_102195/m.284635 type:complete len:214 (+) Transcript_102195:314-955(+)
MASSRTGVAGSSAMVRATATSSNSWSACPRTASPQSARARSGMPTVSSAQASSTRMAWRRSAASAAPLPKTPRAHTAVVNSWGAMLSAVACKLSSRMGSNSEVLQEVRTPCSASLLCRVAMDHRKVHTARPSNSATLSLTCSTMVCTRAVKWASSMRNIVAAQNRFANTHGSTSPFSPRSLSTSNPTRGITSRERERNSARSTASADNAIPAS